MKSSQLFTRSIVLLIALFLALPTSMLPVAADDKSANETDSGATVAATPVVEVSTEDPADGDPSTPTSEGAGNSEESEPPTEINTPEQPDVQINQAASTPEAQQRLNGPTDAETRPVSFHFSMADGGHIPLGTVVTLIQNSDNTERYQFEVTDSQLSGVNYAANLTAGDYTVSFYAGGTSPGRQVINESVTFSINTDEQTTAYIYINMQSASFSQVSIEVRMSDGSNVPEGLSIGVRALDLSLIFGPLSVPAGGTVGVVTLPANLQYDQYQFSFSGSGLTQYSWVEINQDFQTVFLEDSPVSGRLTVGVSMADAGEIPQGLTWSLLPASSWDPLATGPVTVGETSFEHEIPIDLPLGTYSLWISGNGYSSGQVITVQSSTARHDFSLVRLVGTLTVTVETTDNLDIPAGTTWELRNASDAVIQSGTLAEAVPSGSTLPITNPLDFGIYTLNINPGGAPQGVGAQAELPREWLPFSTQINMTNPWVTEYDITANLVSQQDGVSFTVRMSDDGPLPLGLEWSLVGDSYENPVASGVVDSGLIIFNGAIVDPVDDGVYALWITGNGYSSGQVLNVVSPHTHHDFVLDRLFGNLEVTVTTNDGTDIPSGTGWEILDANNNVIQSGVLLDPLSNGSSLNIENPLEFGVYTLNIGESVGQPLMNGFMAQALPNLERELLPFTTTLNITNPWETEYPVTAALQWAQGDVTFTLSMSDGGPVPAGLQWSLMQVGSTDVLATDAVTPGVATIADPVPYGDYRIVISGTGYNVEFPISVSTPASVHDFTLERVFADVTVVLSTSDGEAVPAGATWTITNSADAVIQQGTTQSAIENGGQLTLTNPLEYGIYILTVQPVGYEPASLELEIIDSALSPFVFTVNLVAVVDSEPVEPATPEPEVPVPSTPIPSTPVPATPAPEQPTPAPSTPDPATPEPATPAATSQSGDPTEPAVTGLPDTGAGTNVGIPAMALLASGIALLIAIWSITSRRNAQH